MATGFLIEVLAERRAWPGLWGTVGVEPGTYDLAAGMATSGAITGWLRELTGRSYAELTEEARDAGVGAGGLLMLPYDELYGLYRDLYPATRDAAHALAALFRDTR